MTAQQQSPKQWGTVMSLASYNMVAGGGIGVMINCMLLSEWGYHVVYLVGGPGIILAALLIYAVTIHSSRAQSEETAR